MYSIFLLKEKIILSNTNLFQEFTPFSQIYNQDYIDYEELTILLGQILKNIKPCDINIIYVSNTFVNPNIELFDNNDEIDNSNIKVINRVLDEFPKYNFHLFSTTDLISSHNSIYILDFVNYIYFQASYQNKVFFKSLIDLSKLGDNEKAFKFASIISEIHSNNGEGYNVFLFSENPDGEIKSYLDEVYNKNCKYYSLNAFINTLSENVEINDLREIKGHYENKFSLIPYIILFILGIFTLFSIYSFFISNKQIEEINGIYNKLIIKTQKDEDEIPKDNISEEKLRNFIDEYKFSKIHPINNTLNKIEREIGEILGIEYSDGVYLVNVESKKSSIDKKYEVTNIIKQNSNYIFTIKLGDSNVK